MTNDEKINLVDKLIDEYEAFIEKTAEGEESRFEYHSARESVIEDLNMLLDDRCRFLADLSDILAYEVYNIKFSKKNRFASTQQAKIKSDIECLGRVLEKLKEYGEQKSIAVVQGMLEGNKNMEIA